jgi:hypothetical protein
MASDSAVISHEEAKSLAQLRVEGRPVLHTLAEYADALLNMCGVENGSLETARQFATPLQALEKLAKANSARVELHSVYADDAFLTRATVLERGRVLAMAERFNQAFGARSVETGDAKSPKLGRLVQALTAALDRKIEAAQQPAFTLR